MWSADVVEWDFAPRDWGLVARDWDWLAWDRTAGGDALGGWAFGERTDGAGSDAREKLRRRPVRTLGEGAEAGTAAGAGDVGAGVGPAVGRAAAGLDGAPKRNFGRCGSASCWTVRARRLPPPALRSAGMTKSRGTEASSLK